jgi:hypothetical protein
MSFLPQLIKFSYQQALLSVGIAQVIRDPHESKREATSKGKIDPKFFEWIDDGENRGNQVLRSMQFAPAQASLAAQRAFTRAQVALQSQFQQLMNLPLALSQTIFLPLQAFAPQPRLQHRGGFALAVG